MNKESQSSPSWEAELRILVQHEFREHLTRNTGSPNVPLLWARSPHQFAERESLGLLEESWAHFPAWYDKFSETFTKGTIADQWSMLDQVTKRVIARAFKMFFFERRENVRLAA